MKKRLTLFAVGLSLIGIVGQAAPKTKSAAIRKTPPPYKLTSTGTSETGSMPVSASA